MGAPFGNQNGLGNPGGGRPTVYSQKFVKTATMMCRRGATDGEIAEALGVTRFTVANWQARYSDFAEAFRLGREPADERVMRSAFERAVGYTFDSEKIVTVDKRVERVPIREHVPPDPGMIQYWLNNRRKHEWANRQPVEMGAPGDFDRLSDDDLRKFIEAEALNVIEHKPEGRSATVVSPPAAASNAVRHEAAGRSKLEQPTGIAPRASAPRRAAAPKPAAPDDDLFS